MTTKPTYEELEQRVKELEKGEGKALRKSEEKYRMLAENVSDVIWTRDMNLRLTYVSPSNEKLRGYTFEEAIIQTLEESLTPTSYQVAVEALEEELALEEVEEKVASRSRTLELEQTCKDGSTVWTEVKMSFLRDNDGRPIGILGVTRDITERKRAEETLRDSEAHIRGLNEQILNMLAVVSHDIRSPLFSVASTLKLLKMGVFGKMDETAKNTASDLHARITKLIGTAEDFLGKTSVVKHDLDIERAVLNLREDIVNPVLEELFPEIEDQNITVDNRLGAISASEIPIKADKIWLKIVFRNLFRNAIKYGGKGCTIAFGFADCGSHYKFNVYNNGEPIPEEFRDKVFTKFYRIGNGGKENLKGMGLGLYLTKEIVQKHGGDIWYEAERDGSNFVFTLPHD